MDLLTTEKFNYKIGSQWVKDRQPLAIVIALSYLLLLYVGRRFMRDRQPQQLLRSLQVWNGCMMSIGLFATVRLLPEFLWSIKTFGLKGSFCEDAGYFEGRTGYWVWLLTNIKILEMGDTFFLVAKKRSIPLLHWYHHSLTVVYAFMCYPEGQAFMRWAAFLNVLVHAIMYSYFFLRSFQIKMPDWAAPTVTIIQILQFMITSLILMVIIGLMVTGYHDCDSTWSVVSFGVVVYASYLALFLKLFFQVYMVPLKKITMQRRHSGFSSSPCYIHRYSMPSLVFSFDSNSTRKTQ